MYRSSLLACFFAVGILLAASGCAVTKPPPRAYRQIDRDAPDFKAAVARETARLQARGTSLGRAEKSATKTTVYDFEQAAWKRRAELAEPLSRALAAFQRPSGCWAYTVTTTTRRDGQTTATVEKFDPFQPERLSWTLVSRDGSPPDDESQSSYRTAKLRAWKKTLERSSLPPRADLAELKSVSEEMEIAPLDAGQITFTFTPLAGSSSPRFRTTYSIDPARSTVVRESYRLLQPSSLLGMKFNEDARTTEYVLLEPTLPPFVSRVSRRYHLSGLGTDSGVVEIEIAYSDYRRVKCHDDRFNVQVGQPAFIEFPRGL